MRKFPHTRLRRLRENQFSRRLVCETRLSSDDLIYPLFTASRRKQKQKIATMPGIERLTLDYVLEEVSVLRQLKLQAIALFPVIPAKDKSRDACEAYNPESPNSLGNKGVKKEFSRNGNYTDIALDPYTTHSHDGLLSNQGVILNDESIEVLIKQALCYAQAGVDAIAPSNMKDGRIGWIRKALEEKSY